MKKNLIKGYLFAVLSAVIYGCMPLMVKNIYADGVNPFTLVFLRNFLSLIPLGILAYREKKTLKIPVRLLPSVGLIAALGCCATPILLFTSYRFIASGTATVIHFAYPAIVIIGEFLFLRKKVHCGSLLSVLLCVVGVSMFYAPGAALNLTGGLLALLSGVTFASYVILLSRFDSSKTSGFLFTFYIALVSAVICFAVCLVTDSLSFPVTVLGWGLCVLLSLLVTTGAVVLFQQAAFLIGGERVSILSTLEPITSVVVGVIVFNETMGLRTVIGIVFVIAASILTALYDVKKGVKPHEI